MKRLISSPIFLVFLIWIAFVLACSSSSNQSNSSIEKKPVEYQLAYLDSLKGEDYLKENDVRVNRIRYLLENIAQKSGDSKQQIADGTARATSLIHNEYGKEVKNVEFLEQANAFYSTAPKTKFDNAATLLIMTIYAK